MAINYEKSAQALQSWLDTCPPGGLSAFTRLYLSRAVELQFKALAHPLHLLDADEEVSALLAACRALPPELTQLPKRGQFISCEGGDGSGKTTLTKLLGEKLGAHTSRALGAGTPASQSLRALLLDPAYAWLPLPEAIFTTALLRETFVHKIYPALTTGKSVVCDRWCDTLQVYFAHPQAGVTTQHIQQLYFALVADGMPSLLPDKTFILDLPYELALSRRSAREGTTPLDRNEAKGEVFHKNILGTYKRLSSSHNRYTLVAAIENPHSLASRMMQNLMEQEST